MYDFSTFRNVIRAVMKEHGISQKELAKILGISPVSVSRYFTGERKPSVEAIVTMAEALQIPTDSLLGVHIIEEDNSSLLDKYFSRASKRDQELIWHILREYMTDDEREAFDDWRAGGDEYERLT